MKIFKFISYRWPEILSLSIIVSVFWFLIPMSKLILDKKAKQFSIEERQENTIKKNYQVINIESCEYIYSARYPNVPLVHKANCTNHLTHYNQ